MSDIYQAIADATRRRILDYLVETDDLSLVEICRKLADDGVTVSRQAVSQHVAVLESAALVTIRRDGRTRRHRVDTTPLEFIRWRWQTGRPEAP